MWREPPICRFSGPVRAALACAAVVAGAAALRAWPGDPSLCRHDAPAVPAGAVSVSVSRVVDGDTFVAATGETIRLLGVDAPETADPRRPPEHYGRQAAAFLRKYLEGKEVRLMPGRSPLDLYGRTLAWAWTARGDFVNAELVRRGMARVATYPDNPEFAGLLTLCEREARGAARGLWGR